MLYENLHLRGLNPHPRLEQPWIGDGDTQPTRKRKATDTESADDYDLTTQISKYTKKLLKLHSTPPTPPTNLRSQHVNSADDNECIESPSKVEPMWIPYDDSDVTTIQPLGPPPRQWEIVRQGNLQTPVEGVFRVEYRYRW